MNYEKQGGVYKTVTTGIPSLVLRCLMVWITWKQFAIMALYEGDRITPSQSETDFEGLGVVNMTTLDSAPYFGFNIEGKDLVSFD